MAHAERTIRIEMPHRETLDVDSVVVTESFRSGGVCPEQVARFAELRGEWPAILVRRSDSTLIDGAHRLAAARRLGMTSIEVEFFEGSEHDGFVEFVRRNVSQGLALTLGERKRAAILVLRTHPAWSDRRVGELCVMSPKTVGRLRANIGQVEGRPAVTARLGRDNRLRPFRQGSVRARVADALREQPDASLRTIAAVVGVSPETVRLVKLNLADAPESPTLAQAPATATTTASWQVDSALASTQSGGDFLAWFEQTAVGDGDADRADSVPISRVYVVADEARRRADAWMRFARSLESRTCGRR
jgi:hypothetical protein